MSYRINGTALYEQSFEGAGGVSLSATWEVGYSAWVIRSNGLNPEFDDLQLEGRPRLLTHAIQVGSIKRDLGIPPAEEMAHWLTAFARSCRGAFEEEVLAVCADALRRRLESEFRANRLHSRSLTKFGAELNVA